jgi:hypothetical protein
MATSNELTRIADAVNALRPEWIARSVRAVLDRPELRDRGFADLAVVMAAVAADPKSTTPARAAEPGPWWQATRANVGTPSTQLPGPGAEPPCARPGHEHELSRACRLCRAEQLTALPPDDAEQRVVLPPDDFRPPRRASDRRDFGQRFTLPAVDGPPIARCRCGGAFTPDPDGRTAHRVVFGHEAAVAPTPTEVPE